MAADQCDDFAVDVPESRLTDLRERLARTRWPDQLAGTGWDYGTDTGYLRDLCEYWRDGFDWRAAEARLNARPQVITTIDGQRVHAIHARSPHPDAVPLLLTHGWPGSVVEFLEVIGPLTDPVAHGGDAADACHVVCPSLPGYAWSGPTTEPGWDVRRTALAWDELMRRLGYDRYVAQGGDWGALVTTWLGALVPERLIGIHLNMARPRPPKEPVEITGDEQRALDEFDTLRDDGMGYSALQATRPQTLAPALADSPAGQAAWIVEKFRAWSDCGGDVESAFSRDTLLTNIATYWLTNTAGSSARLYFETKRARRFGGPREFVAVPTGVAVYPKEPWRAPRAWVAAAFDLRHWATPPRGGHFAALEQPEPFVADLRQFVRTLR